jgi:hypothetical protein
VPEVESEYGKAANIVDPMVPLMEVVINEENAPLDALAPVKITDPVAFAEVSDSFS